MIEFKSVTKRFTSKRPPALNDVSFSVREGEIFGLLGHNGAGKSTALGILLGLVRPDSGSATIGGVSIQKQREKALSQVGAIFESPRFYEYLSGWRNLKLLMAYSNFWDRELVKATVRMVGLEKAIRFRVGSYSHGMRQRLALAQALLPRPKLLILDEPTIGLDPDGIVELRERIKGLRDQLGMTVLLSSHHLSEVEQICDRVMILREGQTVYSGGCADLSSQGRVYRLNVDDWSKAAKSLGRPDVEVVEEGKIVVLEGTDVAEVVRALVEAGVKVRGLSEDKPKLESVYMEVSQRTS